MIYLKTPHLQQLEPCAEMLSVTTVPQAPGAFFCSLPKTGKKKISTGFVLHTMYCTPHHSHSVLFINMCVVNIHNQVQKMSITVPWTIRASEILRILLISGFITCTCTLQCTLYILLLKGIPPFYYYFSVNLAGWLLTCTAQNELFVFNLAVQSHNCHHFCYSLEHLH